MDKPKISKRIGSAVLNFFVFLFLAFGIDHFLMSKTYESSLGYDELMLSIESKNDEFNKLQDSYHIYVYDENNKRVENPNVSQEDSDAFFADSRVIELYEELPALENKAILISVSSFAISYVISALGINIALSFAFGKGCSLGGFIFGIKYKRVNGEVVNAKTVLLYDLLSFAFHYVLSILTLGIFPMVLLAQIYYNEKSQSLIEKWLKIQFVEK